MHGRLRRMLAVAIATTTGSCAPAGMQSRPAPISAVILSASELLQTGAPDVLRAVEMTRPAWLSSGSSLRGTSGDKVQVYVESTRYGDPAQLQRISPSAVREIEYLTGEEATARFGRGHSAGAILVRLKR